MRLWQQLQSQVCNDKAPLSFTAVSCSIHFLMVDATALHFLLSDIKMYQLLTCTFFIELPECSFIFTIVVWTKYLLTDASVPTKILSY